MAFRVDLTNFRKFQRKFASATAIKKGVHAAGAEHVTLIQEAFEVKGVDPVTGAPGVWPDKKTPNPKLTRIKNPPARLYDKTPRLQDKGDLVRSINFDPERDGYNIGPAAFPYAAIHQFGGVLPMSRERRAQMIALGFSPPEDQEVVVIPKRPYIVFPAPWTKQIGEAYLSARLKGTGDGSN